MVKQKRSWQNWWQLYVLALLIIGLLVLAHYLAPSSGWRIFLDSGVIVIGYGLITVWLETHSTALLREPPADLLVQIFESPEVEGVSLMSCPVEFHAGSDPAIIYPMPQNFTDHRYANGYRPARTLPSVPEDLSNN